MFAKVWVSERSSERRRPGGRSLQRVHSIFTNIRKDKKAIKDAQLLAIVAALLLVDGIILSAWAIFSPFNYRLYEHEPIVSRLLKRRAKSAGRLLAHKKPVDRAAA